MIETATTVLMGTAILAVLVFIGRYMLVRWWESTMGIHSMVFMITCALLLSLGISREIWGDWIGRDTTRFFSYTVINAVFWWRVWLLFTGQRRNPPHDQDRV